jgi:hypothetical protein
MANKRTVDFLPEIFQTQTNKQFLAATLDQLVQEPQFKKTQGFVGRKIGPGVNPNDSYVVELDRTRADYQLEPGVVRLDASRRNVLDAITYPGINDALATQGAPVNNSDRLYTGDYYTWDPFVDFDKFVNFSQYYWLPDGPEAVDVFSGEIPTSNTYTVTNLDTGYKFQGFAGTNPILTLVRGGTYTLNVNQTSQFWIQQEPGVSGVLAATPNISSRQVLGVTNNGAATGSVTFTVPAKNEQAFFYNLVDVGTVDLVTDLKFNQLNQLPVADFLNTYGSIDGISNLDGRTIIFSSQDASGWTSGSTTVPVDQRYNIWIVQYIDSESGPYINLIQSQTVANLRKLSVLFGTQWSNTKWWKDGSGFWNTVPNLTAIADTLYYQDGTNPTEFGIIRLIELDQIDTLNIENILGEKNYVSPNGVVFTNNLKVVFRGSVFPDSYQNNEYYVAGVGTAIKLLPVSEYVVPEQYVDQDAVDVLDVPDYLVMNLDSLSMSAWSRANRWFHIDVITATATYNNTDIVIDNAFRAKRPILEYRGNLKLFNYGTERQQPVNIIDFTETDALSNLNGTIGYSIDGYSLVNGSKIIFAADTDPLVRKQIYTVEFITPDADSPVPVINLVPTANGEVLVNQTVLVTNGNTQQGVTYYFDGIDWFRAQQKTARNQAPLFDIFDLDGVSFGNQAKYVSTTFSGSKLFSYAAGSGVEDTVLGFPLKYLTLTNIGDIVFDNNFYDDTFLYVKDTVGTTENVSNGVVREYVSRTDFDVKIGWQSAVTKSQIYQQFAFVFDPAQPLILDVPVITTELVPGVKIYVSGVYQLPGSYTLTVNTATNTTVITLANSNQIPTGSNIEVLALSNVTSQVAFYQVPNNLENNPLNENSSQYTLGTARAHYQTIAENLPELQGQVNGANNIRDLGNVIPYGLKILQQSAPLTLAGYFLRSAQYNIFSALEYNSREYEKFKAQLLSTAIANDYTNLSVPAILDAVIEEITSGRTEINPFYWSDMLPSGSVYTETNITYTVIDIPVFDTVRVYNFESANYLGLLVYVNNQQLTRGTEYVVSVDAPTLTITKPLAVGDVITIREFTDTAGSFVPNTPTKLGLYPAFEPAIFVDETYIDPTVVIQGHDGSITIGFGDFRDDLLLEYELRVYNNLKLDNNPVPLGLADVVPGQFRTTDYSLNDINEILGQDFLGWVGWNKLDYKTQDYKPLNEFSYNYSAAGNKLSNNQPLVVGAWRGLYNYFYDTISPNTRPWEMLGFTQEPAWWENYYGAAPYTSGNLVLWDDLEAGLVRDPDGEYIIEKYRRPGLTNVIPSGSEGQLLSPLEVMVGNYSSTDFRKSWTVGDDGPVENAWRTSSSYPFAAMRLLALTRPAEFFSLFADRDLYRFDDAVEQYLYNGRYRLDANGIEVYGNGVSKASFIDWIVDYNRQGGVDSTEALTADLKSLDVRLCYRMAGFSAKNLLQLFTEKSSPDSINSGLLLPDESYNLLLYKNVPFDTLTYSAVIVQKVEQGYAVWGYSNLAPYFDILQSRSSGSTVSITSGGATVQVSTTHTNNVVSVPYGYVFNTANGVADFLISYGALLQSRGMIFDDMENGYVLNWQQMVSEFLYWTGQGWATGSLINLNPNATKLVIDRPLSIVDNISLQTQQNLVLDQDRKQLTTKDLIIDRQDNRFSIETTNSQTISFITLKFVSYEHMIVLDNRSIFADLIYDPVTDARQSRIKLTGAVSTEWNGQLNAPGFILNQDNVPDWQPFRKYTRGELVRYKNYYYSALDAISPSDRFTYSDWTRSDFTQIQQGLLPNLANKSDQLANTYSVTTANLERDQDLFSYGLIGFRPREYMTALNLDDISQVNLYQQFLGTKGTLQSAELFKFADIGRGVTEFDIYENWAVQRATYGANANRSYYELQLNEALLNSNPSIIQVVEPEQESRADQTVLVNNIWKESYKISSPDILTTTTEVPTDISLPTAGYVNIEDIDITVFDINDPAALNQFIDQIGIDTRIWVAKTNNYDWGVFRCYGVPGSVVLLNSNLDGNSTVVFSRQHNLNIGDLVVIRFFDADVDGVYRVLTIPTTTSITIEFDFIDSNQISVAGNGIALGLETLRVAQASDAVNLPESNRLTPGARIWIDNNGQNQWQVIEKQNVFTGQQTLVTATPVTNSRFGASAAQARQNLFAVVGQPNYSESGAAVFYVRSDLNSYEQSDVQELSAPGARSFGASVTVGNQNWIAVGAPDSQWEALGSALFENVGFVTIVNRPEGSPQFTQTQLLTPPLYELDRACEFGYSVALSQDQHWLYVGAPGINRVYAYGLVEVETQTVRYVTTGDTNVYNYSDFIVVNSDDSGLATEQLTVVLNNQLITTFSANVDTGNIDFGFTPVAGLPLEISRRRSVVYTGDGSTLDYDIAASLFTVSGLDSFTVFVNGAIQRPKIDYVFDEGILTFIEAGDNPLPDLGDTIEVRAGSYYQYVDELAPSDSIAADARFGTSVTCTTDGRQVMIGASATTLTVDGETIDNTGAVYVYDRAVQRFIADDATQTEYEISTAALIAPTNVSVNNNFLTRENGNLNGEFSASGNTVTFVTAPAVGDQIVVDVNTFNFIQKISANEPYSYGDFGAAVDICSNDCSLYIGSPGDGSVLPQSGLVQRNINQSRVYGTIASPVANPTVDVGDSIRVNNIEVTVPANDDSSQTTVSDLARAINAAGIPNVVASVTANLTFAGTGIVKDFFIGSVYSSAVSYTPVVFVGTVQQELGVDYTYNNTTETISFVTAPETNAVITVVTGQLILSARDGVQAEAFSNENQLKVLPGVSSADLWQRLEYVTYEYTQTITSPVPSTNAQFGISVDIDSSATTLVVGAPRASAVRATTFDADTTVFDASTTIFSTVDVESGVVYTFDLLRAVNSSVDNPDNFVFGQQILDTSGKSNDQFGTAVNYVDQILFVTSIGAEVKPVDAPVVPSAGRANLYINQNNLPAWVPIREQRPVVDVGLINSVFMYDAITGAKTEFFDFVDPLQGKILGAAKQNIDFISAVDPAAYNVGQVNNYGKRWGDLHVGQIWWDTTNTRFINPNQDDVVYASRRWSQLFPGSTVDVYQWVASDTAPTDYTGEGFPRSLESYSVVGEVDAAGVFRITYYFWVRGVNSIATTKSKTLSTVSVARYIENPRASGIPFVAFLNASATAIYNAIGLISAQDTVLSIEFDREFTDNAVHVEYELIPDNRADGFLSTTLYRKFQDSFCGVDTAGNLVPDPRLRPANRYGIQFRPRQSMFVDRYAALQNYLSRANSVLLQFPISEIRSFSLLNSQEPEPESVSGEWNKRVANIEELSYQNLLLVPVGYRYLVVSDSTQNGLWTIYQVTAAKTFESLLLYRVQTYKTNRYWSYIDWYRVGYNPSTRSIAEVNNVSDLDTITVPVGSSVRVRANSQGKFEVYLLETTGWVRVGLQDGTIEFSEELWNYQLGRFGFDIEVFDSQYFDQEPVIETRKIIQAINQELLIDELAIERNRAMVLMFNFILSEQIAPEWITKTSLVDVDHTIRQLLPFQTYNRDNQEFVIDYIQEVKPYHVQVREFNLIYEGFDVYQGTLTDFDVPAYWKTDLNVPQFVSPVLTPYTLPNATGTGRATTISDAPADDNIWQTEPWSFWYQNYSLGVDSVAVVAGGSGYTEPPTVTVQGDATIPAQLTAVVNTSGVITAINVLNPGSGYLLTPTVVITGVGTGAQACAVMGNNLVRSIKTTLKYDRCEYQADIVDWEPGQSYDNGTLVKFDNRVWSADSGDSSPVESNVFDPAEWTQVPAGTLSAADRTQGYYQPRPDMPGLDLPLLIDGIDYPGVQVAAPLFSQDTGFDIGNFDVNPYDNFSFGPEGLPTYDPGILDAIYESNFLDSFLGTRPTDVNVVGGEFVDQYSSHAPEELVPGSEFDTLDFKVFTTPGADWLGDGHGFDVQSISWIYNSTSAPSFSFAGLVPVPVEVRLVNQTQRISMIPEVNYEIDWAEQTVTVINTGTLTVTNSDVISLYVVGIGGGNQLFKQAYNGIEIGRSVFIPVTFDLITQTAVFVNGVLVENYGIFSQDAGTLMMFDQTLGINDFVTITLFGDSDTVIIPSIELSDSAPFGGEFDSVGTYTTGSTLDFDWSTSVTQYFVAASTSNTTFTLTNSFIGTNRAVSVVEKNGVRATPPAGVEYIADGSLAYALPTRFGESQEDIADTDVLIWIDNQYQEFGVDYVLEPYTAGDSREVIFIETPETGAQILIFVTTRANYIITPGETTSTLQWRNGFGLDISAGDIIAVTSWNNTDQQDILTKVFVGPVTSGVSVTQPYDSTDFDIGEITGAIGSFDYSDGLIVINNNFDLGRTIIDPTRLWVTLNGQRLILGQDFVIDGQELVLSSGPITDADTMVITMFTNNIVPNALAFRIFQDMRGVAATYRITTDSTTVLTQPLLPTDDVVHVLSADALAVPDIANNVWASIIVNGERIMYRQIDRVNNTVSSLLRGTAGTAIATHATKSIVYNTSRINLAPTEYQDRLVSSTYLADGVETEFVSNIDLSRYSFDFALDAVEVYVGGTLQVGNYFILDIDPVTVVFDDPPPEGVEVVVFVRQGLSWYQPGVDTASNGRPLQDTDTIAARFFKGLY